jgi:probable DNA metabolism protein
MTRADVQYRILIEPDFPAWREQARRLLKAGIAPDAVELLASEAQQTLALDFALQPSLSDQALPAARPPSVPKAFLALAEIVACHANPDRWNLLYRVLWRLQHQRDLLQNELDEDIATLHRLDHQVRRDLHKMHAFVRFRMIEEADPAGQPQEHYIAWYRPDHRILSLAVPFFAERFAIMRWTILTHYASASWNPETKQATYGPGVPRTDAPGDDDLATLWRSYYGAIFNPARLNTRAMKAEMPVRYWQNMPELTILPTLLQQAAPRVQTMMATQNTDTAASFVPNDHTLPALAEALPHCKGCDLYRHATQAVFGSGAPQATLMLIGEQPGDEEDRRGAPFIGPAGKVLDRALTELALDRTTLYVTNAVKHFKFIERGKRRIHESPKLRELSACRPWLLAELDAIQPKVVLCLGASAAKSLLGAKFALMQDRGKLLTSPYANQVIATLHPSAILRAQNETTSRTLYEFMKQDLALAHQLAQQL